MEVNPMSNDKIIIHNFGMEITYNVDGVLNHMELVKNFELDVFYEEKNNGLYVYQYQNGKKITLKKPYDLSTSTKKKNKEVINSSLGFTRIEYPKKKNMVKYTKPPDVIPYGCWCDPCKKAGPFGHDIKCSYPNLSSLKLTLRGFVDCLFSYDKSYQSKILKIDDYNKKFIVFKFINEVLSLIEENLKNDPSDKNKLIEDIEDIKNIQNNIDIKRMSILFKEISEKDVIKIAKKISEEVYFIVEDEYNNSKTKMDDFFTEFNLEDVKTIHRLNKSGKIEYYPGTVILQYSTHEKKTTIRFYDNFIHFITIPMDVDIKKLIREVFIKFNKAINTKYIPLNVVLEVAKGSFNIISDIYNNKELNLDVLYSVFHPVDKNKNPIFKNDYMYVKEYIKPDDTIIKVNFTEFEGTKYEYTITPPENKRMTMTFIEYNRLSKPGYYKVTIQLHNSGIIQFTFGYTEGSKEHVKVENSLKYNKKDIVQVVKGIEGLLDYQIDFVEYLVKNQIQNSVKQSFNKIKNLIMTKIFQIYDENPDIFINTESNSRVSDMIYNVVPGLMPYRKKIFPHAGNLVDFFDDSNPDYEDNYGWSSSDEDRGYIVEVIKNNKLKKPTLYKIVKGTPEKLPITYIDKKDEYFVPDKYNECPIVETTKGEAYLLEEYDPDENEFWVILKKYKSQNYEYKHFRIYKYSINGKIDKGDVQVCSKTIGEGTEMRPEPFSFYGRCPGGLNEYINRIGIRSRKDNKFYPVCEKVKNRNKTDKQIINFLMNGMTEEELHEADIDPHKEFEIHGEKIPDKYAGTFRPDTIKKGNKITFWDEDWLEGTIVDYKKDHGLGNDLNYVKFIIEVESDGAEMGIKRYEVLGDQFHPKHRENRNFIGLNNIFKNKDDQKSFIISLAKKLNVIKPTIPLIKLTDKNTSNVISSLSKIYGHDFDFSSDMRKIKPFVKNNINTLGKQENFAILIPSYGIRCILYIDNEDNQYIVSIDNEVMSASIVSFTDNLPSKTIIEGYITENKIFYPIDILYIEGNKCEEPYFVPQGRNRLEILQKIVSFIDFTNMSNSIKIKLPLGKTSIGIDDSEMVDPYIGPTTNKLDLLKFVKKYYNDNNIIFTNNNDELYIWLKDVPNLKVVLQLIIKHEKYKNTWYMGLQEGKEKNILINIPITLDKTFLLGDYVKFKINMTPSGLINENLPFIDVVKSSEEEAKDFEDTINNINLIMYSVDKKIFENYRKWEFPSIKSSYIAGETFMDPLVKID